MSWTERLNDALPRLRVGAAVADVHEWAHRDQPVEEPPHRHTHFEACRVEAGAGEFAAGDKLYPVGPGDLLFARPGVRHRIVAPDGIRLSWVAFDLTRVAEGDDTNAVLQGFLASDTATARDGYGAGAMWDVLRQAARGPRTPGQTATLIALGQALLLALARAGGGEPATAPAVASPDRHARAVRMAVRYVHDNLDRPLRVEELARQVQVSPRQLTRLFTETLGDPPASYVEHVRLERAAGLLARTAMPIKQIAVDLGYPDVPTFTRAFARQHGAPPGRFRRAAAL